MYEFIVSFFATIATVIVVLAFIGHKTVISLLAGPPYPLDEEG